MAVSGASRGLGLAVEDLPLDVFDLVDSGLEVESLTAGHGMTENGASTGGDTGGICCSCTSCLSCGCGGGVVVPFGGGAA